MDLRRDRQCDQEHPREVTWKAAGQRLTCPNFFRGTSMFIENQYADPAVHKLCITIARRCVYIIQAILRDDERHLAASEFYRVYREELDKKPEREPEV